jgi:uncharacterized membrane protein YphA (DoxX/SURF4 family)
MSKATEVTHHKTRVIVSLVASILVGLIFLIAGSGKIFGYGDMPGQTMQFLEAVLPNAWLTPQLVLFMRQTLFPYIIPWAELCLGILLLLRIWPRFFAAITLPLTAAFMANNAWYISEGRNPFTPCPCFGIWGKLLGTPTHVQSLSLDIILFALALTVVIIHPNNFFSSPGWLSNIGKTRRSKNKDTS